MGDDDDDDDADDDDGDVDDEDDDDVGDDDADDDYDDDDDDDDDGDDDDDDDDDDDGDVDVDGDDDDDDDDDDDRMLMSLNLTQRKTMSSVTQVVFCTESGNVSSSDDEYHTTLVQCSSKVIGMFHRSTIYVLESARVLIGVGFFLVFRLLLRFRLRGARRFSLRSHLF